MYYVTGTGLTLLLLYGAYIGWFHPTLALIIMFVLWLIATFVDAGNRHNDRQTMERIAVAENTPHGR